VDFASEWLIYAPPSSVLGAAWVAPSDCVWNGPAWLRSKRCLGIKPYQKLKPLFEDILAIEDVCQDDIIAELILLKQRGSKFEIAEVEKIYAYIFENLLTSADGNIQKGDVEKLRQV
jgi:hypothetical protein